MPAVKRKKNPAKKNGAKNFAAAEKKIESAIDKEDYAAAIKTALPLAKSEQCPPQIFVYLGKAYLLMGDEDSRINAIYWLTRAYEENALDTAEKVLLLAEAGKNLPMWSKTYDLLKKTQIKIDIGEMDAPAPPVEAALRECAMIAANAMGMREEAFGESLKSVALSANSHERIIRASNALLMAHYLDLSAEKLFELHKLVGDEFANIVPYEHDLAVRREEIRRGRRIRVGYISPDAYEHVAVKFFVGLLKYADRKRFEVFFYALNKKSDETTKIVKNAVEHFVNVSGDDYKTIAAKIYADGIDILTDLAGHSANSGLPVLAYKPAPVTVSGIGYLSTTGVSSVDYLITDKYVDPAGNEKFLTERPLYLSSQFSAEYPADLPESEGAPCIAKGYVTFGVFNNYAKITDEMIDAWRVILEQTPGSRLLLKYKSYKDKGLQDVATDRFKHRGIDLARVDFEPASRDYLLRYLDVDIALDTYPYTGGGTTCDALYMGVPVVTRFGERRNTRFSLGLLANLGRERLAADNMAKYIATAVFLARDEKMLDYLHKNLRFMFTHSAIGRPDLYAKEIEEKYFTVLGIDANED